MIETLIRHTCRGKEAFCNPTSLPLSPSHPRVARSESLWFRGFANYVNIAPRATTSCSDIKRDQGEAYRTSKRVPPSPLPPPRPCIRTWSTVRTRT